MPREGVFRDVVPTRYVAIRNPGPQIGFDSMTLGVPTDGAGPRHTITCDGAQRNNPTAGAAVLAQVDENSTVASALRVPARPFSEQGGPERQRPILALVIDHTANAR
jgi:hypothetical protein